MNYTASYFKITHHEHEFMIGKMLPSSECELFSDGLKHTYYNDEYGDDITFFPKGTFEYVTLPVSQIKCSYEEGEQIRKDFNSAVYVAKYTPCPVSEEELKQALSKRRKINDVIFAKFREKHKPIGNPYLTNWENEAYTEASNFCNNLSPNIHQNNDVDPLKEYGYTLAEHQEYDFFKNKNNLFYQELRKKIADEWNAKYGHLGLTFA